MDDGTPGCQVLTGGTVQLRYQNTTVRDSGTYGVQVKMTPVAFTSPSSKSTYTTGKPITGTGNPGTSVTVTDSKGTSLGTTTTDASGKWSLTPTTAPAAGANSFTATASCTPAGGRLDTSTATASDVTVKEAAQEATPAITGPADGSTTTQKPKFTGTGEPGNDVTLTDSQGNTVCTAKVQSDGSWTCTPKKPLPPGDETFTATDTSTGKASPPVKLTVAPDKLEMTGPADGAKTSNQKPKFQGEGAPGTDVNIKDSGGNTVCTARVGDDGKWSCIPKDDLGIGKHTFYAEDTTGQKTGELEIEIFGNKGNGNGNGSPSIEKFGHGGNGGNGGGLNGKFEGRGSPGTDVYLKDSSGKTICTTKVSSTGYWACVPKDKLPPGWHKFYVEDSDGNRGEDFSIYIESDGVVISTGFGGLAGSVAGHRPAA